MEIGALDQFIKKEDKRLSEKYGNASGSQISNLARLAKLGEEFGELCNEVLASNQFQRKEKMNQHTLENLEEEFADVLITTLLLAKGMKVDVEKAVDKKIEKISKREY